MTQENKTTDQNDQKSGQTGFNPGDTRNKPINPSDAKKLSDTESETKKQDQHDSMKKQNNSDVRNPSSDQGSIRK